MMKKTAIDYTQLSVAIKQWAKELGFTAAGITDIDLSLAEHRLQQWLSKKFHGDMDYMERHGTKRSRPNELIPGTIRVISVRMNYWPKSADIGSILKNPFKAFISRYALGRDYHKLIRKRLEKLAQKIQEQIPEQQYRVFCDSAPVLEKPLAEKAGLGWMGKHTNIIDSKSGSWFFLGTLYTNLPLPIDQASSAHCGSCQKCIDICPTQAIIAPYHLDARRCISYLTIENKGSIPKELRPLLGNRIYGCDDCQWICPWNKFAKMTQELDFQPRHQLDDIELLRLFNWTEVEFLQNTQGSAIRRIGYEAWLRNIAVALGNAPFRDDIVASLKAKLPTASPLVAEHIEWALQRQLKGIMI